VSTSRAQRQTEARDAPYIKTPGRKEDHWVRSGEGVVNTRLPDRWGYMRFSGETVMPAIK
jgi:hypothetical protein